MLRSMTIPAVLLALALGAPGAGVTAKDEASPAAGSFHPAGSLAAARGGHTAMLLQNGRVLVLDRGDYTAGPIDPELWDPVSRSFGPGDLLRETREFDTATVLIDGRILVIGGDSCGGYLASAEIWEPTPAAVAR